MRAVEASRCLTCGRANGPVESHHVAGRLNHPRLVVDLCRPCHKVITYWQHQVGVYLGQGPRHPVEVLRSVVVGATLLVELFALRHPETAGMELGDPRVVGRVVSAGLDYASPVEVVARWRPDPARAKRHRIRASRHDPFETVRAWERLLIDLLDCVCDQELNALAVQYERFSVGATNDAIAALRRFRDLVDSITWTLGHRTDPWSQILLLSRRVLHNLTDRSGPDDEDVGR